MAGVKLDVKFNDKSLSEDFGIDLINYNIQSSSSRKSRSVDIPGRDGTYKINSKFSSKKIKLSVVVEDSTTEKVHKKIRTFISWLSQQDEPKVEFSDNKDVFVRADLDTSSDYYVIKGNDNALTNLTIELFQYDPFTYDNGVISYSFEANPNKIYEILNDGIYTPYTIFISNSRNALTQYMATSIGHSSLETDNPIVSNISIEVNGIEQLYQGTLSGEEVLKIDGKELTVSKDNKSEITNWQGDIEDLLYGTNTIKVSNTEGYNLFIAIEFYRRWL